MTGPRLHTTQMGVLVGAIIFGSWASATAAPTEDTLPVTQGIVTTPLAGFRSSPEAAGVPAEAEARFRYLAPLEARFAGDPDFDYLYGTAAHDTGRYSDAVFILQRAVSQRPTFSGARMELARSYYAVGDNESARREFEILKEENPPPAARRAIEDYLGAVDHRAANYQPKWGAFIEGRSGFDSNANGGPDAQEFLGFILDVRNQATESSYYGLAAGGDGSYPFAPGWRAVGDASLQHRAYPDAPFVDSDALNARIGIEWNPGPLVLRLAPNYSLVRLDGNENHQAPAVDVSVAWRPTEAWTTSLDLRQGQRRFVEELSAQDVDTTIVGVSAQHTWAGTTGFQLGASLTTGKEDAVEAGSQFGRDLQGLRLSGALDFKRGRVLALSAAQLNSDFDGIFFEESRRDRQRVVSLGLDWGEWRSRGWLFRATVTHVANSSDVALYDYDRLDAGVAVVREFR